MEVEYIVLISAYFNMKTDDYFGGSFNHYPSKEEIEEAVIEFKKKNPWFEIYYATVEKRYC